MVDKLLKLVNDHIAQYVKTTTYARVLSRDTYNARKEWLCARYDKLLKILRVYEKKLEILNTRRAFMRNLEEFYEIGEYMLAEHIISLYAISLHLYEINMMLDNSIKYEN